MIAVNRDTVLQRTAIPENGGIPRWGEDGDYSRRIINTGFVEACRCRLIV